MEFIPVLIVVVVTVGLCILVDFLHKKLFRSKEQHASGLSVRLNQKFAAFGIIMAVLGLAAIFVAIKEAIWILCAGGAVVILTGVGLIAYYLSFSIFYDGDSFILSKFGKGITTYRFDQIVGQKLYAVSGSVLIELHMDDGSTIGLQNTMTGVYPFMDIAFAGWCRQTDHIPEECEYYNPSNSCWFPEVE